VGAGLSLTYGRQNVIDVANPAFIIVGAYLVASFSKSLGLDPHLVTPLVVMVLFVVGVVVQIVLINPLLSRPDYEMHVHSALVLFGAALFVQTLLVIVYTADYQAVHTSYTDAVFKIGDDLRIPQVKVIAALISLVTLIGLFAFLNFTFFGKAILATYADRQTAQLLSINVKRVDLVTYGLGTAIAGVAGLVVALSFSYSPAAIASWTVMGFAVAVIGGKGSVLGTLLAGLALGAIEAAVSSVSANWIYLVAYTLLLLVFLVRPSGFLGERL
ncbi:MAG: branched-chain amino acid ABC transporter permease, partial [Burkholderiales bacterium]